MNCDGPFKKRIQLECYGALERHGFSRFRSMGVDYPIHEGFHCWVGLNAALFPDRVEMAPNVGLHVPPIERMICALDKGAYARKYDRGVATYSLNIGELDSIRDERAFAFSPEQSDAFISAECERLASIYEFHGLKYARSIASFQSLAPLLEEQVGSLGGNPERFAVCLYMLGRKVEAEDFLDAFPEDLKPYIEGFSIPFVKMIESERSVNYL